jgi:L-ascorbate metabolism protein UlaG (beta-lactamase superfamily)
MKNIAFFVFSREELRGGGRGGRMGERGEKEMKGAITGVLAAGLAAVAAGGEGRDAFRAPDGREVEIECIKHACVRIRFGETEIHVDPVGTAVEPATDYARFPKADLILVTHGHFDHLDAGAVEALRGERTELVGNETVVSELGWGKALSNGDRFTAKCGVEVEAVPAYNTTPGHLQFHPKGRDNGYVLGLGGLRVYVAGDTEDIPEMGALGEIDIAFLPCNQPYTMTLEQAASAARRIGPKVLFPYHCGGTPVERLAEMLKGTGIEIRVRVR